MINGTEKQQAWAERIKANWLLQCRQDPNEYLKMAFHRLRESRDEDFLTLQVRLLPLLVEWADGHDDTFFWIENDRNMGLSFSRLFFTDKAFIVGRVNPLVAEIEAR